MIITLINFVWIFVCCASVGMLIVTFVSWFTGKKFYNEPDIWIWLGIAGVTIYSEIFSLFYRVGLLSNLILGLVAVGIIIGMRKELPYYIVPIIHVLKKRIEFAVVIGLVVIFFAAAATRTPVFYDTDLYHAQAIQWIERYGVVRGLGNFHNRFAYNSAFLCLQALFSWSSIIGQSLHGMNAFLGAVMTLYAIMTFSPIRGKKMRISDFINLLIVYYICRSLTDISSPNTDFSVMLIVLYVFSKWIGGGGISSEQKDYKDEEVLSILILFGITIKFSILPMALYLIKPLFRYMKEKRWRDIGICFAMACVVMVPFIIRNVVISGYVLYPCAWLDLLCVDWKMPAYMAIRDNHEIMAWGRTLNDVRKYGMPFREWFPIWLSHIGNGYAFLVVINFVLGGITVLRILLLTVRRKWKNNMEKMAILITAAVCLLTWLFTAPLIRYGQVYLYLIPVIYAGEVFLYMNRKWILNTICIVMVYVLAGRSYFYVMDREGRIPLLMPDDYIERPVEGLDFQGITVYVPLEKDLTGYQHFPATPYAGLLDVIEMRGSDLKAGFRMKAEYRNARVTNSGNLE